MIAHLILIWIGMMIGWLGCYRWIRRMIVQAAHRVPVMSEERFALEKLARELGWKPPRNRRKLFRATWEWIGETWDRGFWRRLE